MVISLNQDHLKNTTCIVGAELSKDCDNIRLQCEVSLFTTD